MNKPHKLARQHWTYTKNVIIKTNPSLNDTTIKAIEYLYIEAFKHGYKHASETNQTT